jgi:hypothetical protein
MELWQVDIVGGVRWSTAARRRSCRGTDDHSHFAVCARVVALATARPVCDAPEAALAAHGVQQQLDVWVGHYNHERPHQAIGRVPPIERFRLAAPRPGPAETSEPAALDIGRPAPTRRVSAKGTISLAAAQYKAGRGWPARRWRWPATAVSCSCITGVCSSPPPRRRPTLWPPVRCSRRRSAASCLCRRVRRDDPYAIGELVALVWARSRT